MDSQRVSKERRAPQLSTFTAKFLARKLNDLRGCGPKSMLPDSAKPHRLSAGGALVFGCGGLHRHVGSTGNPHPRRCPRRPLRARETLPRSVTPRAGHHLGFVGCSPARRRGGRRRDRVQGHPARTGRGRHRRRRPGRPRARTRRRQRRRPVRRRRARRTPQLLRRVTCAHGMRRRRRPGRPRAGDVRDARRCLRAGFPRARRRGNDGNNGQADRAPGTPL